jgi:hypothetical protein
METSQFEERLLKAGGGTTRRQFGASMFRVAAGAMLVGLLEACGAKKPKPVAAPSSPAPTCATASACNARHYCDPDNKCICIESAEGDIRCGAVPPTCDVPLCTTSADCAFLGEGYFCDTPNSGCCDNADKARCVPPCVAPAVPAVQVGACTSCKVIAPHLPAGDGVQAKVDVTACDTCDTTDLVNGAMNDSGYGRLNASLLLQGFVDQKDAQKWTQVDGSRTVREGLFRTFVSRDGTQTAYLAYGMEGTGGTGTYVLVFQTGGKALYGLGIDSQFKMIYKQMPDPASFAVPSLAYIPAVGGRGLTILGAADEPVALGNCGTWCNIGAAVLGSGACGVACFFPCAFTGPGVLLCAVVLGVTCGVVGWAAGYAACDNGLCKPKQNLYCGCTGKCYSDPQVCIHECHGLSCFTDSCEPNDVKCPDTSGDVA